ncbi:MAG: DUF2207 domain-containing protein [Gemmatimonadetes bacterium]|nr:DUF2207 domain-containing protein [Gemmatimonadota bacterium]
MIAPTVRRSPRFARPTGLRLALLALAPVPAAAQERTLAIQAFHAAISVNPDASIEVTETITARFTGSWNGIYRTIPVVYRTPQGFNWTIKLRPGAITDDAGNPLKTEVGRERHYLKFKIWVPGATDAVKTIRLRYRVTNGLRFFEEHDELYWNVTGDEWEVPIEAASATIRLPPGAGGIRATAFDGSYGSTSQRASVATGPGTVDVTLPTPLGFREGLTAVVGWNKGSVIPTSTAARSLGFVAANWPLVIPIPVFFLMWRIWRRRGKDPDPRPVAVQYQPPQNLTPAECGTLVDNTVDIRDITATVVDLAVKGYLTIDEREDPKLFGLVKDREFVFAPAKPRHQWSALAPHEKTLLEGIFFRGDQPVELSDLENRFYQSIATIRSDVFAGLVRHGYYAARPDSVRGRWLFLAGLAGVVLAAGGVILSGNLLLSPVPFLVPAALTAIIIGLFGFQMPARTVAGARTQEHIAGFAEFLQRVEGDRLRDFVKTPEMFERFLAYAMAFGVEKQWAKAFEGIYTTPPSWYHGGNLSHFNASTFSGRMAELSTQAGSTMSSAPRTSSGSGFSGGSSGGGGGGGGGGGF